MFLSWRWTGRMYCFDDGIIRPRQLEDGRNAIGERGHGRYAERGTCDEKLLDARI